MIDWTTPRFELRRRLYRGSLALVICFITAAGASRATSDPAADALHTLFLTRGSAATVLSADFAARIPPATIDRYVAFYEESIGVPTSIERDGADYEIIAPRGSLRAETELDPTGKIAELRFHDEVSLGNGDALKRLLENKTLAVDWFAATTSRDAAVARTQKIVDGLHAALGAYKRLDVRHGAYAVVFERGETHAQISTDRSGRIVYLSFERN